MSRYLKDIGEAGEQQACAVLISKGYAERERNWQCPLGEIDIIAEKGDTVVFVEVKTRSSLAYGRAAEAITRKKQRQIARTAAAYIKEKHLQGRLFRFDVLLVEDEDIEHIEDAFGAENFTL